MTSINARILATTIEENCGDFWHAHDIESLGHEHLGKMS
jgi:hypothetical protein